MRYLLLVFQLVVTVKLSSAQHVSLVKYDSVATSSQEYSNHLFIHLPKSYATSRSNSYPVIYVLDPEFRFAQTVLASETLSAPENAIIPEAIIVGIPSRDRFKDFTPATSKNWEVPNFIKDTGGSEKFRHYLIKEVIPLIDKTYRTNSNRTIIGHSLGGLFSLELLAKSHQHFFGYVVLDPSTFWNNGEIAVEIQSILPKIKVSERIFIADGLPPEEIEVDLEPSQLKLEKLLAEACTEKYFYQYKGLKGESHHEMPYQGIYFGLKAIFADYQPYMPWRLNPDEVVNYYKVLSNVYQYEVAIPLKLSQRGAGRN